MTPFYRARRRQGGISLISMMVALTISLFLLAGLFTIWEHTRATFDAATKLSTLQENERLALTTIANTVQEAGYYPNYLNYPAKSISLPYAAPNQPIDGTHTSSAVGDTLTVSFVADGKTLDCMGQSESVGVIVKNRFWVKHDQLQCLVIVNKGPAPNHGGPATIVTGVSSMNVDFAVHASSTGKYQYMDSSAVAANHAWDDIKAIRVQLSFDNPLAGQPGQRGLLPPIGRDIALTQTSQ